ncbi:dual OB domain-containing protein [Streptomyces decoyicus]|uniref:dual OB domain-containing protein n=1 Tax=Streptomyces decoyicus TaxID=249567 RepID=UPI00380328B2
MATVKTLVCLANSRKNAGRCVAGMVDEDSGQWIRPVSARPNREVSEYERQYADRSDPRVLDIIAVPLLHSQERSYQSENWLLDPHYYWAKTGRAEWDKLLTLEQHPKTLWINGHSTYHGNNNRVLIEQAHTLQDSLKLIRVDCVTLQVHAPGAAFGDRKQVVDAHFCHAGCTYILRLTDPEYEKTYLAKQEGTYKLGESFLTVSLGEPHEDYAYKLVAAIIERAKI